MSEQRDPRDAGPVGPHAGCPAGHAPASAPATAGGGTPRADVPLAAGALPGIGHLLALARDPLGFLRSLPAQGPMVRIKAGPADMVMVCDPALVRAVLVDDRTFDKGGPFFERGLNTIGNGLVTCPHAQHRRQRRLSQPSFHPDRFPAYGEVFVAAAETTVAGWTDGAVVDVNPQTQALAIRAVLDTVFDGGLPPERFDDVIADLDALVDGIFRKMVTPPFLDRVPVLGLGRTERARDRIFATMDELIARGRANLAADPAREPAPAPVPGAAPGSAPGAAPARREDLLSALIQAVDPESLAEGESPAFAPHELRDQVIAFFGAGAETTATTLSWALYLLARHPEIARRVRREVDGVLATGPLGHDRLPELDLTNRVIAEALRMYPPGWLINRTVTVDTELGGVRLRAGTGIAVSPYVLHHDPAHHPDPERFDPDRRLDHRPDRSFLPFGTGARKCIGDRFALAEAGLALAVIASRTVLEPVDTRPVRPHLATTISPRGLRLRVRLRRPGEDH
ncbi:cytochrome P450 (plasmid) [Streptomyces sp. BI20]|uniref:cytochrome P450 n=1 Tax=Streptomyces sp. BI20 TaxID=3403460 RepID=UPI003C725413